ncbi:DUF3999 domain-containing protein, partial [Stenotrophomonas maltophilia]
VLERAISRGAGAADVVYVVVFTPAGHWWLWDLVARDLRVAQRRGQRVLRWFALPPRAEAQGNDLLLLTVRVTVGRV